ncbi:wobble nucleotide-excising tRNase [Herbaspirillum sp. Sphag1AN]|uniref:AAA family ATPase n=1 Tax=unclassified Herbaspirillum TaxID=2624150 RepID=UPI00161EDE12|nr:MULTISPECIES: AAA family ATPase [unclassified Herbaspirillum]MBB3212454.1 wobble nucleotide-excising tRNase [Herbaspirillum sp. Sphag1AN]MBB3245447.1 wobble nucleotide-excising tRNase [Herbaspirillum sp. Sphag64]
MLKSIQKIKGLGVFNDYVMPAGTTEFGVKNLIYGWNYSGKTTLSRLISLLEHKKPDPDLPNVSFSILSGADVINEINFQTSSVVCRVFNSDFITKNINFAGNPFKPILLLGADAGDAQKKIDRFQEYQENISARVVKKNKAFADAKAAMDRAKTDKASSVKATMSLVKAYGASHLDKDIQTIRNLSVTDHELLPANYEADLKLARTSDQDQLASIPKLSYALNYDQLHKKAETLLSTKLNLTNTIDYLLEHLAVSNWVETGLDLHADKAECEFCGNTLTEKRMQELRDHFSLDLADHKHALNTLREQVSSARVVYSPNKASEFNAQFREQFTTLNATLKTAVSAYNAALDVLDDRAKKKFDAPTVLGMLAAIDPKIQSDLSDSIDAINVVIADNNKISNNFSSEKEQAIDRLKMHFAQAFIKEKKLQEFEDKQAMLERQVKRCMGYLANIGVEIEKLQATISQAQRGREEINLLIERLLGSDSVQIVVAKVADKEQFQLIRKGGKPANHLSEGEKTAIAFSFFITSLKEIKDFSQAIIYIDDPISSLDSNHIFQVNAIIKETFFYKDPNDKQAPVTTTCKQIFLSTHNFEFFSLLRELKPDGKASSHYLVKKISPLFSTFGNMPKSMYRYSSEYHFLFDVLNGFHTAPAEDKTDLKLLMLLPNAVRRFVELYTYSKYPGQKDMTVDQRAEILFGGEKSKRLLKVFHYFSHANNIERMVEQNDLMCDIEGAVDDLMTLLNEKDPLHMEALKASLA